MKLDDLVKDITKRVVYALETPKEERKKPKVKEPWKTHWFGVIPMALSMLFRRKGR